jgi:hypothetical protein
MDKITRAQLLALGGAPDALYAVFHKDGTLYCCTTASIAANDGDFWRDRGFTIKEVTP